MQFKNIFKFSNNDINKFILLLGEKAFILKSTQIIGKNLLKHHFQKKKNFIAT